MNIEFNDFMEPQPIPERFFLYPSWESEICDFPRDYYYDLLNEISIDALVDKRAENQINRKESVLFRKINGTSIISKKDYEKNYYINNKHKKIAHSKLRYAIKIGKIIKPKICSNCKIETSKLEGHHDNYSRPLEVKWFCCKCHRLYHANTDAPL